MKTWIGDKVGSNLIQIDIQVTREPHGCREIDKDTSKDGIHILKTLCPAPFGVVAAFGTTTASATPLRERW